jgi:hypothetical protein
VVFEIPQKPKGRKMSLARTRKFLKNLQVRKKVLR